MRILGISCYYHDSAACLLDDGVLVAAAQEERFSRVKHDQDFPLRAVRYCLAEGGVTDGAIDAVAFYDKPILKFHRILETYLSTAPAGLGQFMRAVPVWLREKLWIEPRILEALESCGDRHGRIALLPGAPRVARGQRVLSVALRGGGRAHDGRRRRVGDLDDRRRRGQRRCACSSSSRSRTRSGCSTRPSRTTPASRSTPPSTR